MSCSSHYRATIAPDGTWFGLRSWTPAWPGPSHVPAFYNHRVLGYAQGLEGRIEVRSLIGRSNAIADSVLTPEPEQLERPGQGPGLWKELLRSLDCASTRIHAEFRISARQGAGLDGWFGHIASSGQIPRANMEVDYEVYADGEARLGWLNCTLRLSAGEAMDGNKLVQILAAEIQDQLNRAGAEVAHLYTHGSAGEAVS